MPRRIRTFDPQHAFTYSDDIQSTQDHVRAFKQRQQDDLRRFGGGHGVFAKRTPFRRRYENHGSDSTEADQVTPLNSNEAADEEAWKNSEGERLEDFGVDVDTEFYDREDDIPLSQLLLRKRQEAATHNGYRMVN